MVTQEELKRLFIYSPETGIFERIVRTSGAKLGYAGSKAPSGYLQIRINYKLYYAHRLAFLWMVGRFPTEVDHINRIRDDNRWINLKEVNHYQNMQNQPVRKDNKAGYRGVYFDNRSNRWIARTHRMGKSQYIGSFKTREEACKAVEEWRIKI